MRSRSPAPWIVGPIALALLGVASCSTPTDRTSLVVQVESDLVVGAELDTIVVNGHPTSLASGADLPVIVGLIPSGSTSASIVVTAIARWHDADVVQQSVVAAFQPGKPALLVVHLNRACVSKVCDADQTCEAGACGPRARTPATYPPTDAASDAPIDRGAPVDAFVDAFEGGSADRSEANDAHDGGPVDGAGDVRDGGPMDLAPSADASPDAGLDASISTDGPSPDVPTAVCGDGITNGAAGETCDRGGGGIDYPDCNGAGAGPLVRCRAPVCGDGYVNPVAGETCEVASSGSDSASCNGVAAGPGLACKNAACGDGYVNTAAGESCDDKNAASGDGCSFPACAIESGYTCATPGQPCQPTCGDGQVRGTEACDDFNTNACGTCSATCTAVQSAIPAIGSITTVASASLLNGETFTVSDGVHSPVTFEFNNTVPVDSTHVQILLTTSSINQMAVRIAAAINSVGAGLMIDAVVNTSNLRQILLTNGNAGAAGNVASRETVANAGFVLVGMSGGLGFDCAAGIGCGSNDDCQSGICCLGAGCTRNTCLAASCSDGILNGAETGVDCGGGTCPPCAI